MGIAATDANGAALTLASTNTVAGQVPGSTPVDPADGSPFKASSEITLAAILAKLPALVNGLSPVQIASLIYPASTANSFTGSIVVGTPFTGGIETVQNLQAAQVSVVCDQPYSVQVQQFMDLAGTKMLPAITFTRLAGVPLNENITLMGDYFRLVVTNTGGSNAAATIGTTFGIMDTQPPALTNEGNFPVEARRPPALLSSYNVAGVITINTVLLTLDCSQYRGVSIQCTNIGTAGVVTPEWSADNTNWVAATIMTPAGATATTFNAAGLWMAPVQARYLRLRLSTATTAGTTTLAVHQLDDRPQFWLATQPVSGTVSVTGYPTAAASADAFANPTVTYIGGMGYLFNGTTWDRARGMSGNLTTGDTGAKSATGSGATIANVGNKGISLLVNLGAFVGGTAPTITFKLQGSPDGGTNWYDIPGATTAALTATGLFGITVYPGIAATAGTTTSGTTATVAQVMPRTWRVVWTITGAPTSITITSVLYNYLNN